MLFIDEIHRLARRRRGGALPGDGGLPARHRAGQGPGGPLAAPRPAPLHPDRRHHPHRAHHRAAARPLRPRRPPRLLRRRRTSRRSSPRAAHDPRRRRSTPTAPSRSPAAARGTPRIANRLLRRVRDFAEVRAARRRRPATWPRPASRSSASTSSASTRSTAPSSTRCAAASAAGRSACRTLAISVGEPTETVEDVYEPFLIQRGLLMRTPRGRVATPAAWAPPRPRPPEPPHRGAAPPASLFE